MRTTKIVTVQFEKKYWTEARAKKWLHEHKYKARKVSSPARFLHYPQNDPAKLRMAHYTVFRTLVLARSLELVIAIKSDRTRSKDRKAKETGGRARKSARKGTSNKRSPVKKKRSLTIAKGPRR